MTTRVRENQLKGLLFLILFIILILQSLFTQAQSFPERAGLYRGLFASFGTRPVSVSSDIAKIDQTNLMEAGGQVGVVFGNNIVRAKVGLIGYYSSTGKTAGTTDLYSSNAALNFYPLAWLAGQKPLIEPYLTGGVAYDRFKFFGYYLNREPGSTNYSQAEAPYLGKIKQINAIAGLGFEVRLRNDHNFIHMFSEVKFAPTLSEKATVSSFENTTLKDQVHVSVGISFGAH